MLEPLEELCACGDGPIVATCDWIGGTPVGWPAAKDVCRDCLGDAVEAAREQGLGLIARPVHRGLRM